MVKPTLYSGLLRQDSQSGPLVDTDAGPVTPDLVSVVAADDIAAATALVQSGGVDNDTLDEALGVACAQGSLPLIELLIRAGADPGGSNQEPLLLAAGRGHLDVVDRLLRLPNVTPSTNDWLPLQRATCRGHLRVIDRLLQAYTEGRPDQLIADLRLLRLAASAGHRDTVQYFLPRAGDVHVREALTIAASSGHVAIVEMLTSNASGKVLGEALAAAAQCGHAKVVKFLLDVADPTWSRQYALRWASGEGHRDIVELLLADPRVDPSADDNHCLRWAVRRRQLWPVQRLCSDDRVLRSIKSSGGVRAFCNRLASTEETELILSTWDNLRESRSRALRTAMVLNVSKVPVAELVTIMLFADDFAGTSDRVKLADLCRTLRRVRQARPPSPTATAQLIAGPTTSGQSITN
ncbi:Ankyrin repeat domain-containing protein [Plasmodiophora brassicae]